MKIFQKSAAQGEITIYRLGPVPNKIAIPKGFSILNPEGKLFVIGHSETGHHHVLNRVEGSHVSVLDKPSEGMRVLRMILENPTSLDHLRPHDTHESIMLEPGEYEVRIAREFDHYQELARKSVD